MQKKTQLQHRRRRRRRQPVTTTTSSNSNNKNNNTCNYTQALCPQKEIHMFKKIPPWDRRPEPQVPDGRLSVGDGLEGVESRKKGQLCHFQEKISRILPRSQVWRL